MKPIDLDWVRLHTAPLDWVAIEAALPFAPAMRTCIQDAVYHAEGDVWTHTKMVVEALLTLPSFKALPESRKAGVFLAALFHDIAKPITREAYFDPDLGRDRVSHRRHSAKGASMTWSFLWDQETPRELRSQVYDLILWHQRAFHLIDQPNPRRDIIAFSTLGIWRELLILAEADARGRISAKMTQTFENLTLASMLVEETECLDKSWPFESNKARVKFMRGGNDASPFYTPEPAAGSHVIVLCGLPGSGKDTYARQKFPEIPSISLDSMRTRLKIKPGENDGAAIQASYEEARIHLRVKKPFVWNATNLTRLNRDKIIDLCLAYDAHVEIHAIDRSPLITSKQNRERREIVGTDVIERMKRRWEPPTTAEAHDLIWG